MKELTTVEVGNCFKFAATTASRAHGADLCAYPLGLYGPGFCTQKADA